MATIVTKQQAAAAAGAAAAAATAAAATALRQQQQQQQLTIRRWGKPGESCPTRLPDKPTSPNFKPFKRNHFITTSPSRNMVLFNINPVQSAMMKYVLFSINPVQEAWKHISQKNPQVMQSNCAHNMAWTTSKVVWLVQITNSLPRSSSMN